MDEMPRRTGMRRILTQPVESAPPVAARGRNLRAPHGVNVEHGISHLLTKPKRTSDGGFAFDWSKRPQRAPVDASNVLQPPGTGRFSPKMPNYSMAAIPMGGRRREAPDRECPAKRRTFDGAFCSIIERFSFAAQHERHTSIVTCPEIVGRLSAPGGMV